MKEPNPAASALGKLSAARFDGLSEEDRKEYFSHIRNGRKDEAKKVLEKQG